MVLDGIFYAVGLTAGGAIVSYLSRPVYAIPFFLLALFCLWFFRDPERIVPDGNVAVSPADGKIVAIRKPEAGQTRVSIFLNVFDVHVNRSPIAGRITDVAYQRGKFLVASEEAASTENEMNTITVVDAAGSKVVLKQIAGLIARRVVCYKRSGDQVGKGERIGYIKFGSRVDVLLGEEWELAVREGQRVAAGASVLARKRT
jgi:phosphatidylserine decarboxylase